jgi:hypothetical protein
MMTREDGLRELELLPLWSLRTPPVGQLPIAPVAAVAVAVSPAEQRTALAVPPTVLVKMPVSLVAPAIEPATEPATEPLTEPRTEPAIDQPSAVMPMQPKLLQHMLNDDGDCMFVFASAELHTDETVLLRNMLMAMAMKTKPMATPADISERVVALKPKLLIALGETPAQYLLQTTLPLADLRGTVHAYQGIALVTSYDLAHLLQSLPDKAHAWADLCLALRTLQNLKSVD